MGRSVLRVTATVFAVTTSVLSSMYTLGAEGYVPGDPDPRFTWLSALGFVAALAAGIMLCWRHRWPVLVTAISLVPPLLLTADAFASLVALAALASSRKDYVFWGGSGLVFAANVLALWRDAGRHPDASAAGELIGTETTAAKVAGVLIVAMVLTGIPFAVGVTRRVRWKLARQENLEQELRDEMARRAERSRIAHEMHDVLGHRLSLLSLQAGALEVSQGSPQVGEAARTVRTAARQSLEDLRQVIGVLRDGREFPAREDGAGDRPQPTLGDVPELVEQTRRAGVPVNLTILLDQATQAAPPLGMAVYRIVQESLTNVLRHAPGATAELAIRGGPGAGVMVEVANPMPGVPVPSPGSGTGLTGISERAAVLGGTVSVGPTDRGFFVLRVWLPWAVSG